MSDLNNMHNELDPRLQHMLAAYGTTPERDPEAARWAQARFMAELDTLLPETLRAKPTAISWLTSNADTLYRRLALLFTRRSTVFAALALLVFAAYIFSGVGITAYAASVALPGDPLYPLKTTMESVRADLTPDSAKQARLYMDFAGRRLVEIQSLIRKGRHNNIARAATEFETDVQKSLSAIKTLSRINPTQAADLRMEFSPVLRSYGDILAQLLNVIPGPVRPALQHAIDACKAAADDNNKGDATNNSTPTPTPIATPVVVSPTPIFDAMTPIPNPGRGGDDTNNNSGGGGGNNGNGTDNSGGSDDDDDDDGGEDDDGDG